MIFKLYYSLLKTNILYLAIIMLLWPAIILYQANGELLFVVSTLVFVSLTTYLYHQTSKLKYAGKIAIPNQHAVVFLNLLCPIGVWLMIGGFLTIPCLVISFAFSFSGDISIYSLYLFPVLVNSIVSLYIYQRKAIPLFQKYYLHSIAKPKER